MDITLIDETEKVPTEEIKETENLLQFTAGLLEIAEDMEMPATFTDNAGIRVTNRDHRGKDMPTDIISFVLEDEGENELPIIFDDEELAELPCNLGDLVISTGRAAEQAVGYGHTLEREMGFLAAHGFLRLSGYDHMGPEDEKEMFGLQEEVLNTYGFKR